MNCLTRCVATFGVLLFLTAVSWISGPEPAMAQSEDQNAPQEEVSETVPDLLKRALATDVTPEDLNILLTYS